MVDTRHTPRFDCGVVVARKDATEALRDSDPAQALQALHDQVATPDDVLEATRELLMDSRRALKAGTLVLDVPAALAGGRLGWTAPAGLVREVTLRRLDALQLQGRLTREDCRLVVHRFGLHGYPGGARDARVAAGRGRQSTTDRINRAMRTLAADITRQPVLPIDQPTVDRAQREEIIGTVLSTMEGPPSEYELRRYVHARVRRVLLDDPVAEVPFREAAERQRAHRAAQEWIAIASDHLERGRLPWTRYPPTREGDEIELAQWREHADPERWHVPSVGAMRALTAKGITEALTSPEQPSWRTLAMLADGYRPLIELTRLALWAGDNDGRQLSESRDGGLSASQRALGRISTLLALSNVIALRGYHHLALAYAGRANRIISSADNISSAARADTRFRAGLTFEAISYLQGPNRIDQTRAWHQRLAADLNSRSRTEPAEVIAVAQAIIRTEHSAVWAGLGSGESVGQLLAPIQSILEDAIARTPAENCVRLGTNISRFAGMIRDKDAPERYRSIISSDTTITWSPQPSRHDEWYCAWPAAYARWDRRPGLTNRDEWRR